MYPVLAHGRFLADAVRMSAYATALEQAVTPGCVVVDIGTGTGIFALLACRYGARRVWAIESDSIIELAREIAAAQGVLDRIEFIEASSTAVTLPEAADVIVSDLSGVLPLFGRHLAVVIDARRRLLRPGGRLVPQRHTLWAAVVSAAQAHRRATAGWDDNACGLSMPAGRRMATNTWWKETLSAEQVLLAPQCWATLDYASIEQADVCGEVHWTVAQPGTAHGLGVWFDAVLVEGVSFSNAPGKPELIYGTAFFPWTEAVALDGGDTVNVTLRADLVGDDYVWRWDSRVQGGGSTKAEFRQSTFFGSPLSSTTLRKQADRFQPALHDDGLIDSFILGLMTGELSSAEIARRVYERFSRRFARPAAALARVRELAVKYSR